ncbi:MAG: restriction endonuclease subunit S [Candidatus Norongarragalinales archaeon]
MTKPGFKQTEIGEIPEEWELAKICDKCLIIKGRKPQKIYEEQVDGGRPYLLVEHMSGGQKFFTDDPAVPDCYEQDTLLIMDGSRSGLVFTGYAGAIGSTFGAVRPKDETVISRFVYYFLQTKYELLQTHRTKGAIPHVDKQILRNMLIPLPPLPEQQKIASVLSTVDEAIQQTNEVIEQAKQVKKGLMQELLTRGIGHKKFKQTEIGEIPEEWETARLTDIANYFNGRAFKPSDWKTKGLPIIRIQNLTDPQELYNYYDGQVDEENLIQKGDLLFSWSATLGAFIWHKDTAVLNQHIFKVIPKSNVYKNFLYYNLFSAIERLKQRVHGSTMRHFRKGELSKIIVPLPPLPEQQKIAEILSVEDAKIEAEVEKKKQLETLKKGLMQDLLTGRVRFPEFVKGANT